MYGKTARLIFAAASLAGSGSAASSQLRPLDIARQVTADYTIDLAPSPTDDRAVFVRIIRGNLQLFTMNLDGSNERQLTNAAANHEDPAWSPDGKTIAYTLTKGETRIVHLFDLATGTVRPVSPPSLRAIHPHFTPDGKTLLFCTDDDVRPPAKNGASLYALDLASGRVRTLVEGGVNTYPVMSPDGSKIAWRKIIGDMNSEVFVANADGSNPRNVTNHFSYEGWPAWSPDGKTLAFAGNRSAAWQIYLVDPDGSNLRLLAATEGRGTTPKWARDGKSVYFTVCRRSQQHRGCDIYQADVPGQA